MDISFVVPAYNEEESLKELVDIIDAVSKQENWEYEVIIVDDGSTDSTFTVVKELNQVNSSVKGFQFRRNHGKAAALAKGFKEATGEFVVTLDADLQDDPREFPEMIKMLKEQGFDVVSGWKQKRKDPVFTKNIPSKFFNYITSKTSGLKLHDYNSGIKAYKKEVIKEVELYGEMHRYIPVLAHWAGYKVTEKPVVHHERKYGVSKYGLNRFINGFLDLLTVVFINKYTKKPLHLFGSIGLGLLGIGMLINFYFLMVWIVTGHVYIRPLMLLGVILLVLAFQFFSMGLLGELITYNNKKRIEDYVIKDEVR